MYDKPEAQLYLTNMDSFDSNYNFKIKAAGRQSGCK